MSLTERRRDRNITRSTQSWYFSPDVVVNGLRLFWVFLFVVLEVVSFYWSLIGCNWPQLNSSPSAHVLLVADAQVRYTHGSNQVRSWLDTLRRFTYDSILRRNWKYAVSRLKPDAVIFLGDMLAYGKTINEEREYEQYYQKLDSMFPLNYTTPKYYIPGNNDVGLNVSPTITKRARRFYSKTFGPFNQHISIQNHTLVLLDASDLVQEDYARVSAGLDFGHWPYTAGGSVEFIKTLSSVPPIEPIILFTHIPLARPDSARCGPLREKGTIRRGAGPGYQNTLGKQTTTFLLQTLRPAAVYSADNRDYCEIWHRTPLSSKVPGVPIREVTVKSFSPARHIRRPGFQLLSLDSSPGTTGTTFADAPCLLPAQANVYTGIYIPLALLSLLLLLLSHIYRARQLLPSKLSPLTLASRQNSFDALSGSDAAIWSPRSASTASPRGRFLRTPSALTAPKSHLYSQPTTPHDSPLHSPLFAPNDEDGHELMFSRYAPRDPPASNMWDTPHEADDDVHTAGSPLLLPGPSPISLHRSQSWSWSKSFVFRGRRRRITISTATVSRLCSFGKEIFTPDSLASRQRGVFEGTAVSVVRVLWPVAIIWALIAWWTF